MPDVIIFRSHAVMAYRPSAAKSIRQNLEANTFLSSSPTQSISTIMFHCYFTGKLCKILVVQCTLLFLKCFMKSFFMTGLVLYMYIYIYIVI